MTLPWPNQNRESCLGRRLWRDQQGVSAVEFALVAPMLILAMLVATDLGLSLSRKASVANAARAGAEFATIYGWNSSGITAAATSATNLTVTATPTTYCGCATSNAIAQQACGTTCPGGGTTGTYVSVATQATHTPISPVNWGQPSVNLGAITVVRTN